MRLSLPVLHPPSHETMLLIRSGISEPEEDGTPLMAPHSGKKVLLLLLLLGVDV